MEVVDKLLQHGATVDLQHQVHNTTCTTCNLFMHRHLTTCIIIIFQDGRSALMIASQKGNVEVVDKLLQRGAKVDLITKVMGQ